MLRRMSDARGSVPVYEFVYEFNASVYYYMVSDARASILAVHQPLTFCRKVVCG
jgi:hypothetical protein